MSGAVGACVIVWSGGEFEMVSGRAVCWIKTELSWSNWWRGLSVIGDNGEEGEGDKSA
jgi:hypothetical protein